MLTLPMQRLVYLIVYPLLWLVSILPFRLLYALSDGLFVLLYYVVGYRKKTVRENLQLVFPKKSNKEIKQISKKFYHHFCDMIVEAIKSMTISEEDLKKRYVFTNIDEIHKIEKQRKSIILMCAHYGSWEWIFIMNRYVNHKGYAVYKRLANKYFDALVKKIRARYDTQLITTKETVHKLGAAKLRGELTINGFVSDQSPKWHKAFYWQKFMGIKVPVYTGAEMLAKKLDMAVVFFHVRRKKRGFYETSFTTVTMNPKEYKDYEITDIFLKFVEDQIKEAPEYYLWTHKRWKHRDKVPPEFQD